MPLGVVDTAGGLEKSLNLTKGRGSVLFYRETFGVTTMNCKYCKFFKEGELSNDLRKQTICVRFPPQSFPIPAQGGIAVMTAWPNVNEDNECGEFKEHPPKLVS